MNAFVPFDPAFFAGVRSYASRGLCSMCKRNPPRWMRTWTNQRGPTGKAYCDPCKRRIETDYPGEPAKAP